MSYFFLKTKIWDNCSVLGLFFVFWVSGFVMADETLDGVPGQLNITISLKQLNEEQVPENLGNPIFTVGSNGILNVIVKNVSQASLAYDKRYINWPQNYSLFCHTTEEMITSLACVSMQKLPNSQDDIIILAPSEEHSHEVYLRNIFPWGLPEQGQWTHEFGQIGAIGDYTLFFENNIQLGWREELNKAGFEGNFFEGT
ncbi:MAG: hypothetical protein FWH27_03470, partial [Planctomycetaceae bacterium]|nr:hypothetical protein [Planctomycetaceae bacterium]